jgi:hypothetical protein
MLHIRQQDIEGTGAASALVSSIPGEINMTTNNRVLGRVGARELTSEEVARVSGSGNYQTQVITVNPVTNRTDGDVISAA